MARKRKPRLAVHKFASCDGCQLSLLDCEDELLTVVGEVEIAYFGLAPAFIGRALGGPLLTRALQEAWKSGPARVWVHTCTLDHEAALANYKARGMSIYQTEVSQPD